MSHMQKVSDQSKKVSDQKNTLTTPIVTTVCFVLRTVLLLVVTRFLAKIQVIDQDICWNLVQVARNFRKIHKEKLFSNLI